MLGKHRHRRPLSSPSEKLSPSFFKFPMAYIQHLVANRRFSENVENCTYSNNLKNKGEHSDARNYRPIAILPSTSVFKAFEYFAHKQLLDYCKGRCYSWRAVWVSDEKVNRLACAVPFCLGRHWLCSRWEKGSTCLLLRYLEGVWPSRSWLAAVHTVRPSRH